MHLQIYISANRCTDENAASDESNDDPSPKPTKPKRQCTLMDYECALISSPNFRNVQQVPLL